MRISVTLNEQEREILKVFYLLSLRKKDLALEEDDIPGVVRLCRLITERKTHVDILSLFVLEEEEEEEEEEIKYEFEVVLRQLERYGLLTRTGGEGRYDSKYYSLSENGYSVSRKIEEGRNYTLRPLKEDRSTMFVACAFGDKLIDYLYESCFTLACKQHGYQAFRTDLHESSSVITELILRGITDSECIIADLTHARPSVYFEVGYALGFGVNILLTCREDHYRGTEDQMKVHFDLEQYKISYWSFSNGQFKWDKNMDPYSRIAKILK